MRNFLFAGLALAALTAGTAVAQNPVEASVTYFGTGCAERGHMVPRIQVHPNYMPVLGGTLAIQYIGRNTVSYHSSTQPVLITGLNKVDIALPKGPPIPGSLLPNQPSNCRLYVTPDLIMYMPRDQVTWLFDSNVLLPIPNNPSLAGFTFYCQWAGYTHAEATGFVHSVSFSPRAEITVGVAPTS